MRIFRNIVQSQVEPDINDLWINSGKLLYYNSNGWEELVNGLTLSGEGTDGHQTLTIHLNDTLTGVTAPVTYSDVEEVISAGGLVIFDVHVPDNGRSFKYPIDEYVKVGNRIELYSSPGATMIMVFIEPDNTITVQHSDAPMPIASELTAGGVRVMDGSGLLIDPNTGNLYVHMTDDPTEDSSDDIVPTVVALRSMFNTQATVSTLGTVKQVASLPAEDNELTISALSNKLNQLIANMKSAGVMVE